MSHLHVPDGVLPLVLWAPALALALLLLALASRRRHDEADSPLIARRRVAYQGALGALVLAAMSVELPLGPFEYHLTLMGPVGVLLGPAASLQLAFVGGVILALVGHGGWTVVGLNALLLAAGAAVAAWTHPAVRRGRDPAAALAIATAVGQAVAGALWLGVMVLAMLRTPGVPSRIGLFSGVVFPLWAVGVVAESVVAFGVGRFLGRVRPDLLPQGGTAAERVAA